MPIYVRYWGLSRHPMSAFEDRYCSSMTSDIDIYRTASVLIREHGEEPALVPAERADSFLEAGDMAGSVVWKQVLKAIKETQRQERGSRELLQLSR